MVMISEEMTVIISKEHKDAFDIVHIRYRRIVHSVCGIRPAIWVKHEIE